MPLGLRTRRRDRGGDRSAPDRVGVVAAIVVTVTMTAMTAMTAACAPAGTGAMPATTETMHSSAPSAGWAGGSAGAFSRVTSEAPLAGLEWMPALDDLGLPGPGTGRARPVLDVGFEGPDELGSSYATPQSETTRHERWQRVHSGGWAETGWLTGVSPGSPEVDGPNHRGYPTVQLERAGAAPCGPVCLIDLWVWLDVLALPAGQWFSLATLSLDASDRWSRVITVNVGSEGWLHLGHVPRHGEAQRTFQTQEPFPLRRWVRVTTLLDARAAGAVAVWQDGRLASAARVEGGAGTMPQAHFGLYAPTGLLTGRVVNDDLSIWSIG